jgi:hypothetical protein
MKCEKQTMTTKQIDEWLATRKEAGLHIDPETAAVEWEYGQVLDPYGVRNLPKEADQIGRIYFARSPESDIWVCFYDLPEATRDALRERHREIAKQPWSTSLLDEGIEEAIESLARKGAIVDTGRRRFSERTGCWQIVWAAAGPE